ncbi:DUF5069 domain-containing protein [Luteolibacter sp. SL250]|uniref:DUF5069 domain-containing protein n=1 Tax=Luteolibacter sp. SL250 TaxID=2995170 RepID=UPI00226ECC3E|nr:DUF5069 domain-containing protein [Luteolibacter sp. SL250]WAC19288.1 DUF5069 domain-containing protein [Luteolibacter sp. SL250]
MSFPIRSARDQVSGIYVFGRILDKIRLHAEGKLPPAYHLGVIPGNRTFDDRVCKFLGVDYAALRDRVLEGGTDEEVMEWCFENGTRPTDEQIEIWNGFMSKRGWRDSSGFEKDKADAGFGDRPEIMTYFDLFDAEEGRA